MRDNHQAEYNKIQDIVSKLADIGTGKEIIKSSVVEDTTGMRIRLIFDGKPSESIRSILESHGFRWSPANTAWQRELTIKF